MTASPFKAYDIRGRIGETLDEDLAHALGRALAATLDPGHVVLGRDIRASSEALEAALAAGLVAGGVAVTTIGLCGTEEVYFATDHLDAGAGVMVTASHNPIDYNGMKIVGPGAAPLPDATFRALEAATLTGDARAAAGAPGRITAQDTRAAYVDHVTGLVDARALPPIKIVANAGNGCAGPTFDAVLTALEAKGARLSVTQLHHDPDGTFPNGIPNPLLPENQPVTAQAVRQVGADLGLAWDGDFDRCFFFDETGAFVPGEYMVGVIAEAVLAQDPGARIVHDPRVIWNTEDVVARAGGTAVPARTGHALVKAAMRASGAAYGGEMSAHHYFRDFMFCDSGMVPWLMVLAAMGQGGRTLGQMVAERRAAFPSSGEINFRVPDPGALMAEIEAEETPDARGIDRLDGLSMDMGAWRFNLRRSNTEPLLRLNVETRGDAALLAAQVARLTGRIRAGCP
ncbi:MAG: phosphomannomutase [Pseudomonadota bacterium]